jgi:hypothetical protein
MSNLVPEKDYIFLKIVKHLPVGQIVNIPTGFGRAGTILKCYPISVTETGKIKVPDFVNRLEIKHKGKQPYCWIPKALNLPDGSYILAVKE